MKKLLTLLLAMVMVVACFASCKKKDPTSESDKGSTPTAHVHSYGNWELLADATCISNGLKKRECECGEVETEVIPALGHVFGDGYVCSRCGAVKDAVASLVSGLKYGEDYTSLYEKFGKTISIADVKEEVDSVTNKRTPYIEKDGKKYFLGLDFLSMAMVYNTKVPAGSETYKSEDDVYAKWWMYYIQRWNELLPELPLYSNQYFDLYNTQIKGVSEHPTNPYWNVANALIDWTSEKSGKDIIIGNTTDLSGKFRYASFGTTNPGAADNDITKLTSGLSTVTTNKEGGLTWDKTVVKSHKETLNGDGTKTFEIELNQGLKFSDGSPITAKNYLVSTLVFSSPVGKEAANKDHNAGLSFVGFEKFNEYDGTAKEGTSKYLSGLKLLGDYKISATVKAEYANYYYSISSVAFGPEYLKAWLDDADVVVDPETKAVGLSDSFYAKTGEKYAKAAHVRSTAMDVDKQAAAVYPYSGPYKVVSYDTSKKEAILEKNDQYAGNYEGTKPSIQKVTYIKLVTASQLASFKSGSVDFIAGITGGADTDQAVKYAKDNPTKAAYVEYGRAGYGKLAFRNDYGTTQFKEVRQALALSMNRNQFALDFNGGYGGTVDGPYYKGSWMYKAVEDEIVLDSYASNLDSVVAKLVEGGWTYGADGNAYVSGVRYKKIAAKDMQEKDLTFKAKDGSAVTLAFDADGKQVEVGSKDAAYYLMPLVINWFGTTENDFSTYVISYLCTANSIASKAGFKICYQLGDFAPMLDEFYQQVVYGYYQGTPMYNMFNFATGFNSAIYDFSYNMTVDPKKYDDYSAYYIKDVNDLYFIKGDVLQGKAA